jgi:hypothetical protein
MSTELRHWMRLCEVADMPHVLQTVPSAEAQEMLNAAFYGGKNKGQTPTAIHRHEREDFVLVDLPLRLIQPNEAGEAYDGTSDMDRVRTYAKTLITTPIFVTYNAWGARQQQVDGFKGGYVADGGHRVSAARLRGATHIRTLMRRSDFDRLVADAAAA